MPALAMRGSPAWGGVAAFRAATETTVSPEGTPEQNLPQGPYTLTSALGPSACAGVEAARVANGTPVQSSSCVGTPAQSWSLVPINGPYGGGYQVISSLSGSCLDVSGFSMQNGGRIHEWTCVGPNHTNQIWQIYPFGDHVELVSLNSGKCLDLPNGNIASANELQQWSCGQGSDSNQLWTLTSISAAAPRPLLSTSTPSLNFGNIVIGSTKSLTLTLTSSGTSPITIASWPISGSGYSLNSGAPVPLILNPGGSVALTVTYRPSTVGQSSGSLTINSDSSGGAISVPLSGTGTGTQQLAASASSLDFGTVALGSSKSLSTTLSATGTSPVIISSWPVSGSGYSLTSGGPLPLTLNPGGSVTLTVTYQPSAAGQSSGSLTVNSNSVTANSLVIPLGGATAVTQHSVDLSWDPPPNSPDPVAGYRIYRSIGNGPSSVLNYTLATDRSYADATVANGITYQYVVKSVDGSGVESVDSNAFTVTIPVT